MKLKHIKELTDYVNSEVKKRDWSGVGFNVLLKTAPSSELNRQIQVKRLLKIKTVIKIDCIIEVASKNNLSFWRAYQKSDKINIAKAIDLFYLTHPWAREQITLEFHFEGNKIKTIHCHEDLKTLI
jgi:hypothetical protein